MRLSPYGACAAAGLMVSMALAGRSARRVQIPPDLTWDTGFFAIACCFVASRLLLILSDPRAFAQFPILVLSLPSLTIAGMALAAVAVAVYLWRKRFPVLALLDAFAPSGALLAACLELGHWLDGSEIGMPILRQGDHAVVGFRPVSIYGVVVSLGLLAVLWRALRLRLASGRVAALALMLGGLAAFALDTLTVPAELFGNLPLEPGQMVALGAMLGGAVLWTQARERTPDPVAAVEPEPARN